MPAARSRFLPALAALACAGGTALAEPTLHRTPWDTRFPGSPPWELVQESADGDQWTRRWMPTGEPPQSPRAGIVEMHFRVAEAQTPGKFLAGLFVANREVCTRSSEQLLKTETAAGYAWAAGSVVCAQLKDQAFGHVTHYLVLARDRDVFVVSRALRRPAAEELPLEMEGEDGQRYSNMRFTREEVDTGLAAEQVATMVYLQQDVWLCGPGIEEPRCPDEAAGPRDGVVVSPVFSQKLRYHVPENWRRVFQRTQGKQFLLEYVPAGESVESWTRMLTISGIERASWQLNINQWTELMSQRNSARCPDSAIYEILGSRDMNGFAAMEVVMGCAAYAENQPTGTRAGQGEVAWILVIQGRNDIYTVQKALRGAAFEPAASPVTRANAAEFAADIGPVTLCKGGGERTLCEPDRLAER